MIRFRQSLENLRATYWFVPALMALVALVAGVLTNVANNYVSAENVPGLAWLYRLDPPGARAILSTIAGSAISVASVVFSITIVALSTASGQFGPRLMRNFTRQGWSQIVLGVFIGTFLYSLVVLAYISQGGETVTVPHLAVAVALLLGVLNFGTLIYFIHHVSQFIQAPRLIADLARELMKTLEEQFPEEAEAARESPILPADFDDLAQPVAVPSSGYLQAIDEARLIEIATGHEGVVRLRVQPGAFLVPGQKVADLYPPGDEETADAVASAFLIGTERFSIQDVEFDVEQMVEIAVRALSPGINDPFTAISVLDRLGEALCLLSGRRTPPIGLRDENTRLRLVRVPFDHDRLVGRALDQIHHYARSSPVVLLSMVGVIEQIIGCGPPPPLTRALLQRAEAVRDDLPNANLLPADRARIERQVAAVQAAAGQT